MSSPALFLDRDGTVIHDQHYLRDPDQVVLETGAAAALKAAHLAGYRLILITNQSGIGQGIVSHTEFLAVQRRLQDILAQDDIPLLATYYCPHHPTKGMGRFLKHCRCRKPKPGMILDAISDHAIDPSRSFMIGDKLIDCNAGAAAGVTSILVQTGYGATQVHTHFPTYSTLANAIYDRVLA
jgi:D,D-heptose 1,7-bisphosphate phosphatase